MCKLMLSEVMSFKCSDSCENGIVRDKEFENGSDKSHFSEFQKNVVEFSKCQTQMHWRFSGAVSNANALKFCIHEVVKEDYGRKSAG